MVDEGEVGGYRRCAPTRPVMPTATFKSLYGAGVTVPYFINLAPDYDFSEPPHSGKLWYECMGWPMTGVRWRELATAAQASLQEQSCR